MDTYFTEINHVLLASRGYEYDGFLDFLHVHNNIYDKNFYWNITFKIRPA